MCRIKRNALIVAAATAGIASLVNSTRAAGVSWTFAGPLPGSWSTAANWFGTGAAPTSADDVFFIDAGSAPAAGTVTNVVNQNFSINSLLYQARADTGKFHTTQIPAGVTLTIAQGGAGTTMLVGTAPTLDLADAQVNTTITGQGSLVINSPSSNLIVRQTATNAGLHKATLDMSGLAHFNATVGSFEIARAINNNAGNRAFGTVFLAADNTISAGTFIVGLGASNTGTGQLFLGTSNVLNVGTMSVGERKQLGQVAFNTGINNGSLKLRALDGVGRVSTLLIGAQNLGSESTATVAAGTVDLTASSGFGSGSIDAMIDNLLLGRANAGGSLTTATGRLTYDRGVVDVNNITLGAVGTGAVVGHRGQGILEVKDAGSLIVNSNLTFAQKNNAGDMAGFGTFNILGAAARVQGDIVDGTNNSAGNATISASVTINVAAGTSTPGALTVNGNLNATGGTINTSVSNASTLTLGGMNVNAGTVAISGTTGSTIAVTNGANISGGSVSLAANGARFSFGGTLVQSGNGATSITANAGTFSAAGVTSNAGTILANANNAGALSLGAINADGGNIVINTSGGASLAATSLSIVNNGSVRAAKIGSSGSPLSSTTFNNGTLTLDLGSGSLPATPIVVTSALTADGTNKLNLASSGALSAGTFAAVDYSSIGGAGFSSFSLGVLPNRVTAELINNTANTSIDVHIITGGDTPKWVGNISGNWDVNTTANWKLANAGTATTYQETGANPVGNDSVLFDDTATGTTTINVATNVLPNSVTFNNSTKNYTLSGGGQILGGGALNKNGTARVTIANASGNVFGTTSINAGTVTLVNNSTFGPMTVASGAAFEIGDGVTAGSGDAGTASIANSGTVALNRPDDFTTNVVLSGGGTLVKRGAGAATLNGVNSGFTGNTVIETGRVFPINTEAFGTTGPGTVNVLSGAAVDVGGAATNVLSFGGRQFVIAGNGTDPNNGALTDTGNAQQNAFQRVALSADASIGGPNRFDIRGTLLSGFPQATLDLAGHTLTKVGANFLGLVAADVSDGNIVVNAGTIDFERSTNILNLNSGKTITLNDGVTAFFFDFNGVISRPFVVNGAVTMGNDTNNPAIIDSNFTLNGDLTVTALNASGTGSMTLNGVIGETGGAHSITKNNNNTANSRLVLAGNNTYSGGTTINGGTVQVGAGGASGSLGTGPVTNNGSLAFNRTGTLVVAQNISGSGQLFQVGAGTTVLSGTNTYGGTSTVQSGRLVLAGAAAQAPVFTGGGAIVNGGRLIFDYNGGTSPGATVLSILDAGFDQSPRFSGGQIRTTNADDPAKGLGWKDDTTAKQVTVGYTYYGDANLDGQVDVTDLGALATNWQTSSPWAGGDFNYDGFVDVSDLGALATNWQLGVGNPLGPGSLDAALASVGLGNVSVPEPSVIGLTLIGLSVLRRRRRYN
jgi:fibronectin-binding autotransporter adhesin